MFFNIFSFLSRNVDEEGVGGQVYIKTVTEGVEGKSAADRCSTKHFWVEGVSGKEKPAEKKCAGWSTLLGLHTFSHLVEKKRIARDDDNHGVLRFILKPSPDPLIFLHLSLPKQKHART